VIAVGTDSSADVWMAAAGPRNRASWPLPRLSAAWRAGVSASGLSWLEGVESSTVVYDEAVSVSG
jgi:hypothetical protein